MHHLTDRITHTTAFVISVVKHWLERKIMLRGLRSGYRKEFFIYLFNDALVTFLFTGTDCRPIVHRVNGYTTAVFLHPRDEGDTMNECLMTPQLR